MGENMKIKKEICVIVSVLLVCLWVISTPYAEDTLSKYGSRGGEVTKIQQKLHSWGYYNGNVDGIYGWRTAEAIKLFQRKNGLSIDGIAGPLTLEKLGITSASAAAPSYNSDLNLIARAINGEARGEPYTGQVAVGAVILNRVGHSSFPNTIAGVVYQPGAFTAVADGQINAAMVETSIKAARDALNGWDPAGGAIYYYNPRTATNQWIRGRPIITTIGKHVFCN